MSPYNLRLRAILSQLANVCQTNTTTPAKKKFLRFLFPEMPRNAARQPSQSATNPAQTAANPAQPAANPPGLSERNLLQELVDAIRGSQSSAAAATANEEEVAQLAVLRRSPLTADVTDQAVKRIQDGEYVDLGKLFSSDRAKLELVHEPRDKRPRLEEVNATAPLTLPQWLTRFEAYTSIRADLHPAEAARLFDHQHHVRAAAALCKGGSGWFHYDRHVRIKLERESKLPASMRTLVLGQRDPDLWAVHVMVPQPFLARPGQPGGSKGNSQQFCGLYNARKPCPFRPCKYAHRCKFCGGSHPNCRRTGPSRPEASSGRFEHTHADVKPAKRSD